MTKRRERRDCYVPVEAVVLGDGWIEDDDCEFMWFRIYPHRLDADDYHAGREVTAGLEDGRYDGLEIIMGLDAICKDERSYNPADQKTLGYANPEFYIERDQRFEHVNGSGRTDYGYVPIPVHDAAHLLAILRTPAAEVIRLLTPALEWARVVPTLLENVDPADRECGRIVRLFDSEETPCSAKS